MTATIEETGFTATRVGTGGCGSRSPGGNIIAWTVDEIWAAVIVRLLTGSS